MDISDYYYILTYSGTFFLLNSIISLCYNNIKLSIYVGALFLTTILNWNIIIREKYKIIKKIDKFYVSFIIITIIKNILIKLKDPFVENIGFYDILVIGFIIQILFFYSLSKICTFLKNPKKAIFHSIMHLNGFVMTLFITQDYTKIL
jgi:hypothetical protein